MYQPKPPPFDAKQLPAYVADEFQAVAQAASDPVDGVLFNVLHVAPSKPREGLVVCADGVDWQPLGAGGGFFGYFGAAWVKLG